MINEIKLWGRNTSDKALAIAARYKCSLKTVYKISGLDISFGRAENCFNLFKQWYPLFDETWPNTIESGMISSSFLGSCLMYIYLGLQGFTKHISDAYKERFNPGGHPLDEDERQKFIAKMQDDLASHDAASLETAGSTRSMTAALSQMKKLVSSLLFFLHPTLTIWCVL